MASGVTTTSDPSVTRTTRLAARVLCIDGLLSTRPAFTSRLHRGRTLSRRAEHEPGSAATRVRSLRATPVTLCRRARAPHQSTRRFQACCRRGEGGRGAASRASAPRRRADSRRRVPSQRPRQAWGVARPADDLDHPASRRHGNAVRARIPDDAACGVGPPVPWLGTSTSQQRLATTPTTRPAVTRTALRAASTTRSSLTLADAVPRQTLSAIAGPHALREDRQRRPHCQSGRVILGILRDWSGDLPGGVSLLHDLQVVASLVVLLGRPRSDPPPSE
jgi:hypothetical protein